MAAEEGHSVRLWPSRHEGANLIMGCGKCIGCRTKHATQWARRCEHEARYYPVNSFVTLTYDDSHLPPEGHLVAAHLQLWLKRVRKHAGNPRGDIDRDRRHGVRFFACGEYGTRGERPHYHAILFNAGFRDAVKAGSDVMESARLTSLWGMGGCRTSEFTPARANYIAQYSLKKQGDGTTDADGVWRPAPFLRMSQGIGKRWLMEYRKDLSYGYLDNNGTPTPIPRYYRKKLKDLFPEEYAEIEARAAAQRRHNPRPENSSPERLAAGEEIHRRRKEITESRTL